MSTQKRGRACLACSSIKIKCELGSDSNLEPPCGRCVRLNKECTLSVPKRQKDRVAELEEQVATLTQLLHQQKIGISDGLDADHQEDCDNSSPQTPPSFDEIDGSARKRRIVEDSTVSPNYQDSPNMPPDPRKDHTASSKLDNIVSRELQGRILQRYLTEIVPVFPVVPISGDTSLDSLHASRPILLEAITYAASPGILVPEIQEDVARMFYDRLTLITNDEGQKPLDLIQAVQIACLWYWSPKQQKHVAVHQLIGLASRLADQMGISNPLDLPNVLLTANGIKAEAVDALRVWLGCYHLSTAVRALMRATSLQPGSDGTLYASVTSRNDCDSKANSKANSNWAPQPEQCLLFMERQPNALTSDRFAAQYFRAERLCNDIIEQMELTKQVPYYDISRVDIRTKIQVCKAQILKWKINIPQDLRTPSLMVWEHVAIAYTYEAILHTPTNKKSFSAPYVPENLSVSDFPQPVVTQDHTTAIFELLAALHAIIDIMSSFDVSTTMALPGLLYGARAAYANFMLAKLFIAVTAPGNTLGSILNPSTIRAEEYCLRLVDLGKKVQAVDDTSAPARVLSAAFKLKEWYKLYKASMLLPSSNSDSSSTDSNVILNTAGDEGIEPAIDTPAPWTFLLSNGVDNGELNFLFDASLPFEAPMETSTWLQDDQMLPLQDFDQVLNGDFAR